MRTIHPWEVVKLRPAVTELTPAVSIASGYSENEDYRQTQAIA
jgi:hypothetical protein